MRFFGTNAKGVVRVCVISWIYMCVHFDKNNFQNSWCWGTNVGMRLVSIALDLSIGTQTFWSTSVDFFT